MGRPQSQSGEIQSRPRYRHELKLGVTCVPDHALVLEYSTSTSTVRVLVHTYVLYFRCAIPSTLALLLFPLHCASLTAI